jgi:hypothetical protein
VSAWDSFPVLLVLLPLGLALSIGAACLAFITVARRKAQLVPPAGSQRGLTPAPQLSHGWHASDAWLAVKCKSPTAVQSALGLHNAKPCPWSARLASAQKLFISPPVNGWILVLGDGFPDPGADIDACFRFIIGLSRKLGRVQFFSANPVLKHHAWVHANSGRIVRAYAWAGKTLWLQGDQTPAERDLGLTCFPYAEPAVRPSFTAPDPLSENVDKLPQLAARWSLDPARIDERSFDQQPGIAGELLRRF